MKKFDEGVSKFTKFVNTLIAIIIVLMIAMFIGNVYVSTLPTEKGVELRCRMGDSVACLSVPR